MHHYPGQDLDSDILASGRDEYIKVSIGLDDTGCHNPCRCDQTEAGLKELSLEVLIG